MYKIYFFHVVFEIWDGANFIGKFSDMNPTPVKEGESVVIAMEEWAHRVKERLTKAHDVNDYVGRHLVLVHASFQADPATFEQIPEEINA